jgi:hypothetical protein
MTFFWIKHCNKLVSQLQEKPSALKREHPAIQKLKFIHIFLCLWVIFTVLDPDPECKSGYGFRDPIEIRIRIQRHHRNPDPEGNSDLDPQQWKKVKKFLVFKCWMFSFEG